MISPIFEIESYYVSVICNILLVEIYTEIC